MPSTRGLGSILMLVALLLIVSSAVVSAQTIDVFLPIVAGTGQSVSFEFQDSQSTRWPNLASQSSLTKTSPLTGISRARRVTIRHRAGRARTRLSTPHGAVYEGSIPGRFGDRKPPSAAYATLSPILYQDKKGLWIGGNFWDGRATGAVLGNPAADQALGPFLNPAEQALPDSACVVYRVCAASYPVGFAEVWGDVTCDITWPADVETTCATEGTTWRCLQKIG